MILKKIISGGQTGADQAGLDAGVDLGLETGGWIPKGRRTEAGPMSQDHMILYGLKEHRDASYAPRTLENVIDSDGTALIGNISSSGSKLTINVCESRGKPFIINPTTEQLKAWLAERNIEVLNVAGNRESVNPGIGQLVYDTLVSLKEGV